MLRDRDAAARAVGGRRAAAELGRHDELGRRRRPKPRRPVLLGHSPAAGGGRVGGGLVVGGGAVGGGGGGGATATGTPLAATVRQAARGRIFLYTA